MQQEWFDVLLTPYYLVAFAMWVVAILGLATCIYSLVKGEKTQTRIVFACYFSSVIIQGLIVPVYSYMGYTIRYERVNQLSESIFAIIEFIVFSILLHTMLVSRTFKIILKLLAGILPAMALIYYIFLAPKSANAYPISVLGGFLLISICLVYFYELFLYPPTKKLTKEPAFWTATGILLYLVCLIPTLLALQFVSYSDYSNYESLAFINFIASSTLYVFFIKALLCKTYQATSL